VEDEEMHKYIYKLGLDSITYGSQRVEMLM
jgi:hypothetical protein